MFQNLNEKEMQLLERLQEDAMQIELDSKFSIDAWIPEDLLEPLGIDEETFIYLLERTAKETVKDGLKKGFNAAFIFEDKELVFVTTIGLYMFLDYSSQLKKYAHYKDLASSSRTEAIHDLIRFYGAKSTPPKKKKPNNIPEEFQPKSFEDMAALNAKKIGGDLKIPNYEIEDHSHLFYRKSVVVTGTFEKFPKRTEMAEWIKAVGGNNNGSVSGKTDFVVIGENAGPKKLSIIEKNGIRTISETEFLELFPNNTPKFS